jgi:hypothetical protein
VRPRQAWEHGTPRVSVPRMDEKDKFTADLEMLLRETDREDPILPEPRTEGQEPREEIDEQILAGLVHP